MFHPDTQALIDLWTALSRGEAVRAGLPARAALRPDALGPRLTRAFLAERSDDDLRIRLAGDWLEAFHDGPLTGATLSAMWRAGSIAMVGAAVRQSVREARPVVIVAGVDAGHAALEVTVTAFQGAGAGQELILGLVAPTATLTLPAHTPHRLSARMSMAVGDPARPRLALAALDGRRIA
ncbi:MAG: PAS domain-containing protein [Caulobacteraceae bacterium]|nr:PAS domain-containing protein [Caulobacteraceae bacterium]